MEETEEDLNYLGTSTEFQCSSCPSSFSAIEDLISHCDSIHGSEEILELPTPPEEPPKNEKKLRCDLCSATFSKQSGLEFHLRKSHTFCSSSIFVPSKPKDDEIHQIDIDDDEDEVKPSEIVICDDIESDEDPEVIEVNLCDLRPEEVKIKKSRSSKPLPMTCPICLKTFSEAKFDGHFRHAHGKPEKQNVKCTKCDQVFKRTTTSSFWKKHWSTCKGEKRWKFTCEKCQYVFSKRQSYVKHIEEKICEKKPVKKTVPSHCQVCTELFDSKQALRQHIVERHPEIKMFKCEKCPLIFPTFSYLRTHLRLKHKIKVSALKPTEEDKTVECPLCQRPYFGLGVLKNHISSVHRNEMTPELERVLNADNLKTISKSEAVKTSVNTNVCYLCNQVEFKVKEDYDKHMNEVHKFINNCKYCQKWFSSESTLRRHLEQIHRIQTLFQCWYCPEKSKNGHLALNHYKAHHGEEDLINDEAFYMICVDMNPATEILPQKVEPEKPEEIKIKVEPEEKVEKEDVPIPSCDICKIEFDSVDAYIEHSKTLHKRTYVCQDCFKCYQTPQSIRKHLKKDHSFVQKYKCDTCSAVIRSEYHMKLHFQRSHPVENLSSTLTFSKIREKVEHKKHSCPQCQKEFTDEHKVRQHISFVHENFKPYECSECEKFFRTKSEIVKHNVRVHEGSDEYTKYNAVPKGSSVEKPFKCPICSVGFTKQKQLKTHILKFHPNQANELLPLQIAIKEKTEDSHPYLCQICQDRFTSERYYKSHYNKNHPLNCPKCLKGFEDKSEVKEHLKEHKRIQKLMKKSELEGGLAMEDAIDYEDEIEDTKDFLDQDDDDHEHLEQVYIAEDFKDETIEEIDIECDPFTVIKVEPNF